MNCGSCAKAIDNDSAFCKFCGTPVSGFSEDKILPTLFAQITDELRSRRQAEYIYTAAALGAFGATAWGVATLAVYHPQHPSTFLHHPIGAAALGSVLIALAVNGKILSDHCKYAKMMKDLKTYSDRIASAFRIDYLSKGLKEGKSGLGFLWSMAIVLAGGILAVWFCCSSWQLVK